MAVVLRNVVSIYNVVYSGRKDNIPREGVTIMFSNKVKKALIESIAVNERIITARFGSRHGKMTVVMCYSPTDAATFETKTTSMTAYKVY